MAEEAGKGLTMGKKSQRSAKVRKAKKMADLPSGRKAKNVRGGGFHFAKLEPSVLSGKL